MAHCGTLPCEGDILGGGGLSQVTKVLGGVSGGTDGLPVIGGITGGILGDNNGNENRLNDLLAKPLSLLGLGSGDGDGILDGFQSTLGKTLHSLGLAINCDRDDCNLKRIGNGKEHGSSNHGILKGLNPTLKSILCSLGLGCEDCDGPLEGLNPTLQNILNSLGLGGCNEKGGKGRGKGINDDCGCGSHEGRDEHRRKQGHGNRSGYEGRN